MKTNFIYSTFTGITFLLIIGCASMTNAPSTPLLAIETIREWSAPHYASAAAVSEGISHETEGRGHVSQRRFSRIEA
jgi:hypothetical protein